MGSICHRCVCIVLYMKLIWCHGFPEIYAQLEAGGGSICHSYMCNVLYIYMKLIWCNGFPTTMLDWRRGGVDLPWVYVHCDLYETYLV